MNWFVYIIECSDQSLYTGITPDIRKRLVKHNSGNGAKYVRGKLPVVLVYKEKHLDKKDAAKREREIKGWRREKKLILIQEFCEGLALNEQSS